MPNRCRGVHCDSSTRRRFVRAWQRPTSQATANKMLSALRGVIKAAWQLGQMSAEDFHRAYDLQGVRGSTVGLAGRELQAGELGALLTAYGR